MVKADTKFHRIVCADNVNLNREAYERLQALSETAFVPCDADPVDAQDLCQRIGDSDCCLISWRTRLDESVLSKCQSLRYIGLCASKYSNPEAGNIDIKAARQQGITVTAVQQYGDEATAEFIFCALLNLCRGFGKFQWRDMPCELHGKTIGIIGMGEMGRHVMRLAQGLGMHVVYFSRTRKPACEKMGARYVSKAELLRSCNIVSLHVPKGTHVLTAEDFAAMGDDVVLVNTALGIVFAPADFADWIAQKRRVAIMDESVDGAYSQFKDLPNVIFPPVVAGRTAESCDRLSAQVLENAEKFLSGDKYNVIN